LNSGPSWAEPAAGLAGPGESTLRQFIHFVLKFTLRSFMTKILTSVSLLAAFAAAPVADAATKSQRQDMKRIALEIMLKQGAELELSPEVTSLKIISEDGKSAVVNFSGIEWGPYEYKCQFTYSFEQKAAVPGSVSCL
jgi:hypothetical protein